LGHIAALAAVGIDQPRAIRMTAKKIAKAAKPSTVVANDPDDLRKT
jgi:hypothetical protein